MAKSKQNTELSAADLSIVACSRNDDHGKDMALRMRLFVRCLLDQCRKHQLKAELILVEWNPPEDKAPLSEVLPKPGKGDFLTIRYITVPTELHKKFRLGKRIHLFQMIGKNVGIRRAKGNFVLCTNVDLLFSDELMLALKNGLEKSCFYRANRCDIPAEIDENQTTEEILAYAEKNIMNRLGQKALFPNLNRLFNKLGMYPTRWIWLNELLNTLLKFRNMENDYRLFRLDTYACGDFTLMSKEAWMIIGGYLEADLYSIHIDSLGLIAASALGLKQVVFSPSACTYHIYHESGWESMDAFQKLKFLEERPGYGWEVIYAVGKEAFEKGKLPQLNTDDWGFANHNLPEVCFVPES